VPHNFPSFDIDFAPEISAKAYLVLKEAVTLLRRSKHEKTRNYDRWQ
jgi:hypothetical protein